ncbi:pyruvate dehydrogenase complex dihydrolipoamide acetyltransferase [Chelatococcus reniformis]|uniref:Acetyltransferase component of pyruvate dehydrogenase complex n=1 Tax=Chelatococcus reniformis TaxID=1494448 RepID=A0A916U1L7_9HYPH|nr:pyruvate dehydrogenase complex dihydrolipoamide acetyltransferase [Chelatococcus reniformis]GGC55707.1 acetyltransferase component of pyruvate dehydrogenase complex [Chelatococcus reniformis]
MPTNILMPALSPTMEKGTLAKWLKKEGDAVKSGDVLAEIETDKATMEVEAVDEGVLAKILVPDGTQDVAVNQPIAIIAGEGEDIQAAAAGAPAPQAKAAAAPPTSAAKQEPAAAAPPARAGNGHDRNGGRVFASPLARRLAKAAGIDLSAIAGSGPHGRVVERDVTAAQEGGAKAAPKSAAAAAAPAAPALARGPSDDAVRAMFAPGSFEEVPHDAMRRTIARRLTEAKQTIPHFYLTMDCEIDALLALREEVNKTAPTDKDGDKLYKVSVNDFIIKAMAMALMRVPDANVSWTETAILKHKHADVGVAVSIPGGLITPIVRRADEKTLSAISNEMKEMAGRARNRRLKPEEYTGGSTAVSNLGMFGVRDFAAIINPPHATILAVGEGEKRVIVRGGEPAVATLMTVTLSTDHRAVDGALGARLLGAFRQLIEHPMAMLV